MVVVISSSMSLSYLSGIVHPLLYCNFCPWLHVPSYNCHYVSLWKTEERNGSESWCEWMSQYEKYDIRGWVTQVLTLKWYNNKDNNNNIKKHHTINNNNDNQSALYSFSCSTSQHTLQYITHIAVRLNMWSNKYITFLSLYSSINVFSILFVMSVSREVKANRRLQLPPSYATKKAPSL